MNEPAKNPGQQPESYQPQKPEMMRALEEAQGDYRHISEIQPLQEVLEIFRLSDCRAIGIEQTYKLGGKEQHAAAPQWARVTDSEIWKTICALPRVIPNACFGWTCECVPKKKKAFSYFVAMLTPADTPVPEGCQFRDVPTTLVAAGRWDEPMEQVIEQMKLQGVDTHYNDAGCGWNAELYLDAEQGLPTPNGQEWRWLIPCKEEAK
jgi:hypothetical protein